MSIPHVVLSNSQYQILTELMRSTLPNPVRDPESAAARGLNPQQVQADVPTLLWMGVITETNGTLSVTAFGAALFHRAEQEKAENQLSEVVAFADALEASGKSEVNYSRIPYALRKLAQGDFSLDEAVGYLA
ncbi:hypothetical protein [Streptomyces sp. DH37]|uniref:hypothetical protein n=1 Tax=Streptomyces sp. DH37 TaxID=3040122 RepID=UPI002441DB3E|nr:hypothetical protein [Streptomyces sp. DH37]MDG9704825.1 hypothetical protein [Streptomyces sp. DH37]